MAREVLRERSEDMHEADLRGTFARIDRHNESDWREPLAFIVAVRE